MIEIQQAPLVTFLEQLSSSNAEDIMTALRKPKSRLNFNPYSIKQFEKSDSQVISRLMQEAQTIDSKEQIQQNKEKLDLLSEIVKKWSLDIAEKEQRVHRDQLKQCAAVLIPYGSIVLGVADSKSDIDLICVAPSQIERKQHFFQGLYDILAQTEGVEQINKIESTQNPIIKMVFKGLHIDINFAQLNSDTIPKSIDDSLDELRQNLFDTESINALNGRKNGILIRDSAFNNTQFIETLKIIKFWSKRRGITGNILGYLGGISWAILVSKVCQLFPDLDEFQTVAMFFQIYSQWNWKNPITIDDSDIENKFGAYSWKDDPSKTELMKVITPAFPYINSTFKVSVITFNTIQAELQRGATLTSWAEVVEEFTFFDHFQHYITISIVANDVINFHKWSGFCEAQLPKLLKFIAHDIKDQNAQNSYEIRIDPHGHSNLEQDFAISSTYLIGIRKTDPLGWPLFLRSAFTRFAIDVKAKKVTNNFNDDFNMKIYLQNSSDYQQTLTTTPQDPIHKKVKLDQQPQIVKRSSVDSDFKDPTLLSNALDDLF